MLHTSPCERRTGCRSHPRRPGSQKHPSRSPREVERPELRAFPAYTPLVCLLRSDRSTLCREFVGRLVTFIGEVPGRFRHFLPERLTESIPIQGVALRSDALATNVAVLKELRTAVVVKHRQSAGDGKIYPLIGFFCAIHQLALSRKSLIYGFPNFWSSITRLSHLFEVGSFRTQFRAAVVQEICAHFQYKAVSELPSSSASWQQYLSAPMYWNDFQFRFFQQGAIRVHQSLMKWDNGNPESTAFQHYCTGDCCQGSSLEEKSRFCLVQVH